MSQIVVIPRPNMRKFGTIYEVEVRGLRLCRKDGSPRRFGTAGAAQTAGEAFAKDSAVRTSD
ncbi:hypothetical protein [Xanthobacter aminoxidans]|uniref:Uncharacterized protein n=1 Tax=Xanthobacter aminoxidans TaxID=186280 RepID=A0ABW6ZPL7_9HYPH